MMPQIEKLVGIDVAKDWLDVAIGEKVERIANSAAALHRLAARLVARGTVMVGLEPTGGYERLAVTVLREAGLDTRMVDSWRLRQFAKSRGTRAKSDPIDARMIRLFLADQETRPFPEPSQIQLQLTAWVREVMRAEADLRRLVSRRAAVALDTIVTRIDAEIAVLEATIAEAEQTIEAIIAQDAELARKAALISSVPGVGPKTTRVVLAELPEIGCLTQQSVAALCGVAPYARSSGKSRRHSYVEGGRAALKRAGFLAARAMTLHNTWAKQIVDRLRANGKAHKVAIIALARRLFVTLNAMIKNGIAWQQPSGKAQI